MTVTYDGSKITTDTLYESGTIQVKKGFEGVDLRIDILKFKNIDLIRTKEKVKILNCAIEDNLIALNKNIINLQSSRTKEKIKLYTLEIPIITALSRDTATITMRTKTVIITP